MPAVSAVPSPHAQVLIKSLQTGMYCRLQSIAAGSSGLASIYAKAAMPPPAKRGPRTLFKNASPPSTVRPRPSRIHVGSGAGLQMGSSTSAATGSVVICDVAIRDAVTPMVWTGAGEAATLEGAHRCYAVRC